MKCALAALFVFLAASPAFGRELMTNNKTPVYEKPDKKSKVLTRLEQNIRMRSDKRKDFWFHVSIEIDGKQVSGWVNQADVTDLMGRSKGQLLAENKRFYEELLELRKAVTALRQKLQQASEENARLKEELNQAQAENAELKRKLKEAAAGAKSKGPP